MSQHETFIQYNSSIVETTDAQDGCGLTWLDSAVYKGQYNINTRVE